MNIFQASYRYDVVIKISLKSQICTYGEESETVKDPRNIASDHHINI